MAPVIRELKMNPSDFEAKVAVTGQHREMLDSVLHHFEIIPDWDLDIMRPRQTLTETTMRALEGLDAVIQRELPDVVMVHGDTLTTFVASLAAYFHKVSVAHVEAGLRTGDKYAPFPEEMMRVLTDRISDLYFAPTSIAASNLSVEGVPEERIFVTGNTGIDALLWTVRDGFVFEETLLNKIDYSSRKVIIVEVHRRENFGQPMRDIADALRTIALECPEADLIVSLHKNPEAGQVLKNTLDGLERVYMFEPFDYPQWANLMSKAHLIITDSGGLQEEAPSLGTPVLLTREKTERPEAIQAGTVKLVGSDKDLIVNTVNSLLRDQDAYQKMNKASNPFGDGKAAQRIISAMNYHFHNSTERPADFTPI